MIINPAIARSTGRVLRRALRQTVARPIRSLQAFAEAEITIPTGPYEGLPYTPERQPATALYIKLLSSGHWPRNFAVGPTQSGKTFAGSVLEVLWHLVEVGETVIFAAPTLDMAWNKWERDFIPVIEASTFRHLLPRTGPGSRGGQADLLRMGNGKYLKFMAAGGSDKTRSHFESRVVVYTELDGFDKVGGESEETTKRRQIENRTRAHGDNKRIYAECTVTTEEGATWHEYVQGTETRVVMRCPHCLDYVLPEREDLHGALGHESIEDARTKGHIRCPACEMKWSEADRTSAVHDLVALHRGQEIARKRPSKRSKVPWFPLEPVRLHIPRRAPVYDGPEEVIVGAPPRTDTLGYRWNAVHNLFNPISLVAAEEHRNQDQTEHDAGEREMSQFWWATPYESDDIDYTQLGVKSIRARSVKDRTRGVVPPDTEILAIAFDVGKYQYHWVAGAFGEGARCHIVDYGATAIPEHTDIDHSNWAIQAALLDFLENPPPHGFDGRAFDIGLVDSGAYTAAIYRFCQNAPGWWLPVKGADTRQYHVPAQRTKKVRWIGEQCHESKVRAQQRLLYVNVDHWKQYVHDSFSTPIGQPGAVSLFHYDASEKSKAPHTSFAQHIIAEKRVEEFTERGGRRLVWQRPNRNNHYLDCTTYLCAGASRARARLEQAAKSGKGTFMQRIQDRRR